MRIALTTSELVDLLSARLRAVSSSGGGWGYFPDKRGRIEPTCWVLLALNGAWPGNAGDWDAFAAPHLAFLASRQSASSALTDTDGGPTNLAFDGLAATIVSSVSASMATERMVSSIARTIVDIKGIRVNQADQRQDNTLQAWPWVPDTFSWVEPTAWCMLALKRRRDASAAIRARLDEAERMLANRCCESGGWNYGNASVIGQDLRPHIPTTAVALIALQDRRELEFVRRSAAFLQEQRFKEISSIALGLAAVALRLQAREPVDVLDRIQDLVGTAMERGDIHAMAVALFALTLDRHDARAFRVA
jgi:hypothetical protein